jgi:hypothetical protein
MGCHVAILTVPQDMRNNVDAGRRLHLVAMNFLGSVPRPMLRRGPATSTQATAISRIAGIRVIPIVAAIFSTA